MYSYVWANLLVIKQAIRLLHLSVVIELRHYYTMDMPTDRFALLCLWVGVCVPPRSAPGRWERRMDGLTD